MLADAAVAAGATLREPTSFVAPLLEDGRLVGVRNRHAGVTEDVRARNSIGSGKRSRVARTVGPKAYDLSPCRDLLLLRLLGGDKVQVHEGSLSATAFFMVAVPCVAGLTLFAVSWSRSAFADVRAIINTAMRQAVAQVPWLANCMVGAR